MGLNRAGIESHVFRPIITTFRPSGSPNSTPQALRMYLFRVTYFKNAISKLNRLGLHGRSPLRPMPNSLVTAATMANFPFDLETVVS